MEFLLPILFCCRDFGVQALLFAINLAKQLSQPLKPFACQVISVSAPDLLYWVSDRRGGWKCGELKASRLLLGRTGRSSRNFLTIGQPSPWNVQIGVSAARADVDAGRAISNSRAESAT